MRTDVKRYQNDKINKYLLSRLCVGLDFNISLSRRDRVASARVLDLFPLRRGRKSKQPPELLHFHSTQSLG